MSTPNRQLPTPKGFLADRLRVLWELGVGSWEFSRMRLSALGRVVAVALAVLAVAASTHTLALQDPAWQLVWSDEFDTPGLPDSGKWSYEVGGHGWGNRELQF